MEPRIHPQPLLQLRISATDQTTAGRVFVTVVLTDLSDETAPYDLTGFTRLLPKPATKDANHWVIDILQNLLESM